LFDEELVRNQDDELNYRIQKGGGRLWQSPTIRCWYWPRASLVALFNQYLQYGFWKVRVIQKHQRPASWRHVMPVVFVLGLAVGCLAGFLYPPLSLVDAAALAAYGVASLVFSARAAATAGWDLFPFLPTVFFVYHVSYGVGFAAGLVYFFVLRPRGDAAMNGTGEQTPSDGSRAAAA
jgi:hypothetical protein